MSTAPSRANHGATPVPKGAAQSRDTRLRRQLLRWWDSGHRDLPWRERADSYGIWIAEVMAQQTRLAVVAPAWERFMAAFPDIETLAHADEEAVLSLWSGLGYYSRARALHRAAGELHAAGESEFPREWEAARALPGVGDYTAAAVLSIAHQRPHAAVDGNVVRVLSRLDRLGAADAKKEPYTTRAGELLATRRPGDWNEALMELGETFCRPKNPICTGCPWHAECAARLGDVIEQHPPRKKRRAMIQVGLVMELLRDRTGRLLLERGAFPYLPHLWLPPIRELATEIPRGDFRHTIVHRKFEVRVTTKTLSVAGLERRARLSPAGVERRIIESGELAALGRSSLLTKALRQAGWD
ncbi:MAG: A/G-specific adenine glycosylase [Deltaproteobacteria bacterium]